MIADPELFGPEVVRAAPYEGDPRRWAVLGEGCAWRQEPVPKDVLASLTRYFEVPAAGGKGSVRLSATVTVHRTALAAAWGQAGMLEEVMACPEQTLRPGERLTGLMSAAYVRGDHANRSSEDRLTETGQCHSAIRGGPYPYHWSQGTFGVVTVGASGCGGRRRGEEEVQRLVSRSLAWMESEVEHEIGRPVRAASGSAESGESGASPGSAQPGVKGGV